MDEAKRKRLAAAGWRVSDSADFLALTPEEVEFVELKLALGDYLRRVRVQHRWTQTQVARRIGSSQSRVAKMEAADPSVTLDLLVKSLLRLGVSTQDVGRAIEGAA
ncbi:MAG: helix-turn-helix domain-containing protein [Actinobacteria bacterium]|nr:helix-turn-helix domain-containing protein [Actinomycetota bacterium]